MARLLVLADGEAGQRDQVVHIGQPSPGAACRPHPCVVRISRPRKQPIERKQSPTAMLWRVLAIDLLQTEYVGPQPLQRRPEDLRSNLKRHPRLGWQIEALKIEGGNPHVPLSSLRCVLTAAPVGTID